MNNPADRKGHIVQSMDKSMHAEPVRVWAELPPGVAAWRVGSVLVVIPALKPGAPHRIRRAYLSRVIANATGTCPACGEVVALDASGPSAHGLTKHDDDCPVLDLEQWADPRIS